MRLFIYYFIDVVLSIFLAISLILNQKIMFIIFLIVICTILLKNKFSGCVKFVLVILSLIGFFNTINYYSVKNHQVNLDSFRVVNKTSKDIIVKSQKIFPKKYIIRDFENIEDLKIGMVLFLNGNIEKHNYYDIGVVGEIKNYKIDRFESDFTFRFMNIRNSIKNFFVEKFGRENGNVLSSLTFGDTSDLDKQYKNNLKSLGLLHILSVSGFHMNLVFMIVSKFLNSIPSLIISFIYLLFTGVKVSGMRAFTMMFLKESSSRFYRTYDAINALCFSGVVILIFRCYEIFNMGFIYSFASTFGILIFNKKINNYFYKFPKLLADSLSLILSAQVFVLPINILVERKFGISFLFSNILLVPFYSILMFLGILFIFLGRIPVIGGILCYFIKIIFAIIDGGIIFIRFIFPNDFYLNNYIIIFILCLYVIYFLSTKIGYNKVKNIPILLFGLCFILMNNFDLSVDVGKYFDKNYVILRNRFKSYMYIDKKMNDSQMLEEKLGVDAVIQNFNGEDIEFYGNKIKINFEKDRVFIQFNLKNIYVDNVSYQRKYYSDIYPNKFYVIF